MTNPRHKRACRCRHCRRVRPPRIWLTLRDHLGTFTYKTTPDADSDKTIIGLDVAAKYRLSLLPPPLNHVFDTAKGQVTCVGRTNLTAQTDDGQETFLRAVVSRDIKGDIIIGRDDLRNLGLLSSFAHTTDEPPPQ